MTSPEPSYFTSLWSWMVFGTKVVGTVVLGLTLLIYFNQEKILYIPNPPGIPRTPEENPRGYISPDDWSTKGNLRNQKETGIPFEDHIIRTKDDVRLHAWLLFHPLPAHQKPYPTLIYFHGNAANMGFRLPNAARMYSDCKINILMVDYRGYGKSEGNPTEKGLQYDAEAALEFVTQHRKLQGSPVIVFGRSLGGAVSLHLARRYPASVSAIILENTFLSISAMTDILLPIVKPLKPYLLRMHWDSENIVGGIDQPLLFISGGRDELVPPTHMRQLFDLAMSSKHREWFWVEDGRHNDTWERAGAEYYKRMKAFIDQHVRGKEEEDFSVQPDEEEERQRESLPTPPEPGDDDYYMVTIPTMATDFSVNQQQKKTI